MNFKSINPYNGEVLKTYSGLTSQELTAKLDLSQTVFTGWKTVPLKERMRLMANAGKVLRDNTETYAKMITLEMGKPITESRTEITKCAWVCEYYAENAESFLANEIIKTDAQSSFVQHDPIGSVLAIMPWNFPFGRCFVLQHLL